MPWQNNGDGPKNQNPWGQGGNNSGGSGGSGGPGGQPPNVDDMIRKGQEQLKKAMPGGAGGFSLVGFVLLILWLATGIYKVDADEEAVILQFGQYVYSSGPGTNWHLPFPIQSVEKRQVTAQNTIEIGTLNSRRNGPDSQMLTGDENIVDVKFTVVWKIGVLSNYLFNLQDPQGTIRLVSESVMREIVGKKNITDIITDDRKSIESEAATSIQATLDAYGAGVRIERVSVQEAEAPEQVKDAFLDVQRAAADGQKYINEAQAVANRIIPEAKGKAAQIEQVALAYYAETVARAEGEASRFMAVYQEYRQAQSVTRKRIYLETMEDILEGMNKIILDGQNGGSGVVPYLPLNELQKRRPGSTGEND